MNGMTLLQCICEETRFSILDLLQKNKEMAVNDIVLKLRKEQPLISHHLKALKQCNLVKTRENGKMTMYSISSKDIANLISDIVRAGQKMVTCCEVPSCKC